MYLTEVQADHLTLIDPAPVGHLTMDGTMMTKVADWIGVTMMMMTMMGGVVTMMMTTMGGVVTMMMMTIGNKQMTVFLSYQSLIMYKKN